MLDMTSFAAALKEHYSSDAVQNLVYTDNPLLAMMKKDENFRGKTYVIPLIFGNPQAVSASFATGQAKAANTQIIDWVLRHTKQYAFANIDGLTIEASKGDANAFMEAATTEIDGAMNALTNAVATDLFGSGSGSLARVASFTGSTITLAAISDVVKFEVGMTLVASATDGTGSVRAGSVLLVGVNRDTGVLTTSVAVATGIATIAATDYLFKDGDYNLKLKGLSAWLPATAPASGDNFFGVDRSQDATRLAGIRVNGTSMSKEQALLAAASRAAREGGKPDTAIMSFDDYTALVNELGAKVQYFEHKVGEVGFTGIKIIGPRGTMECIPDRNCPVGICYVLEKSTWKLCSAGPVIQITDLDGLKMLRQASSDGVEVRIHSYAQMACSAPGRNVRLQLV